MKQFVLIIMLFANLNLFSQTSSKEFYSEIISECDKEVFKEYLVHDFSSIFVSKSNRTIGFIGENYQRIKIHLVSVIKNQNATNEYLVYGKSKVKNNVCEFLGKIEIQNICLKNEELRLHHYKLAKEHGDEDLAKRYQYQQGRVIAKYSFYENKNQQGTGIFEGVLKSDFYVKNNEVRYDDLEKSSSDVFNNNQFVGEWKSYKTGKKKSCNWGDYRIPYSYDLDIGVAEFSVNEKYLNFGWEDFYKANVLMDSEALKQEEKVWW